LAPAAASRGVIPAARSGRPGAGAHPGPACYGRGSNAATVTDANLFLGRLGPSGLLGGSAPLDAGAAASAITSLAQALAPLPLGPPRGIVAVVNANMAGAVRLVTVQRGVDPAGLALLAFSGAGPLACRGARARARRRTVVVPPARVSCAHSACSSRTCGSMRSGPS
jgi:N-methylhydantoinase A